MPSPSGGRHRSAFRRFPIGGRIAFIRALLLGALMLPSSPLPAHPDLLLQIERLDGAIAADPQNAELLARRGNLHRRHRDYEAAAKDLEAARAADPDYALVDFLEAELLLDTGRPDEARQRLSRYLATRPEHAAAWMLRGRAYLGLGQPGPAADDFGRAIDAGEKPGPELYRLQVLSLAGWGAEHADAALAAVQRGLERFPVEVSLLGLAVDITLSAGRAADAARYLERLPAALRNLPQWQARIDLADCMAGAGDAERSACLATAREKLDRQVAAFLAGHAPAQPSQIQPHH